MACDFHSHNVYDGGYHGIVLPEWDEQGRQNDQRLSRPEQLEKHMLCLVHKFVYGNLKILLTN